MRRLGLTGSIGMGKSVAAAQLRRLGLPVFDADAEVHRLLAAGGAGVRPVAAAFPGVEAAGAIDRGRLGRLVFGDRAALDRLERLLHPLVAKARGRFLARQRRRRVPLVVLDIPLLFEGGGERICDRIAVVSCAGFLQRQRVLARPNMDAARLRAILARQLPDAEKRRRADFVVPTGIGRRETLRRWVRIVAALRGQGLNP